MKYYLAAILADIDVDVALHDASMLGCAPAELMRNPEADRPMSFASHDCEAELRLYEDGFSQL